MIVLSNLMVTHLLDVIELISWEEACVHKLNHLFLLKYCLIYKMNVSNLRPYKLPRGFSYLIVCVIYHPPANDDNALIEHITSKPDLAFTKHPNAGIFLVGGFNICPVSLLFIHFGLKQIVKQPTRKNITLDLIPTD